MSVKSILVPAGVALLSLLPVAAKAQQCQFIGVYEIYPSCYLRITTCGASTIGTGCSSGGQSADKPKPKTSELVTPKPQQCPASTTIPAATTERKDTAE
jgi:hypothetical protein